MNNKLRGTPFRPAPIKIAHNDDQELRKFFLLIPLCLILSTSVFVILVIHQLFFKVPVEHTSVTSPQEIQQVFDELTALKTGLIKSNSTLEERLVRIEECLIQIEKEQKVQPSK